MFVFALASLLAVAAAAPGYPELAYDDFHLSPAIFKAPLYQPAPIFKALPAPVYTAPVAPVFKAAPVIAAPVIKALPAATSYATVTQVHVAHPQPIVKVAQPIVKTILAPQPIVAQPLLKSFALPAPAISLGHDYWH